MSANKASCGAQLNGERWANECNLTRRNCESALTMRVIALATFFTSMIVMAVSADNITSTIASMTIGIRDPRFLLAVTMSRRHNF